MLNKRQKSRWGELGQTPQEAGSIVCPMHCLHYSNHKVAMSTEASWATASTLRLIILCIYIFEAVLDIICIFPPKDLLCTK